MTPHGLRCTFAVKYLSIGSDVFKLQRLMYNMAMDMVMHFLSRASVDIEEEQRKASPADY